jgi:hypothetical protein
MTLSGIKDLLPFLQFLYDMRGRPWYLLRHTRYDAVTVELHMPGVRLEVDFFDDHIEYSTFEGDESVHDDQERLFALIEERGK